MRILILVMGFLVCALPPAVSSADPYVPGQLCCILEDGRNIDEVNARWGTTTITSEPGEDLYLLSIEGIEDLEAFAEQMGSDPSVCAVGANYRVDTPEGVRQMVIPAVGGTWDDYQDQSLTERIGLDEAHRMSRGAGVVVAVLDTGVDPNHIAFDGRLAPNGYDFIDDDDEPWETANGQDDDGDGTIDEGYAHGTMVAGIVALVAPDALILPIRVLDDEGLGTVFSVTQGILYATAQGADVYNMSFGIPLEIPSLWPELQQAAAAGAILVAGAGNEDREEPPYYPAIDPLTFMVTAVDSNDVKAGFADFNDEVNVCAPGVGVRSAYPGDDWGIGSGCSFATPFVSGEVALILTLAAGDGDIGDRAEVEERVEDAVENVYDNPANEDYDEMLGEGRIYLPAALDDISMTVPDGRALAAPILAWPNPSLGAVRFRFPSDAGAEQTGALTILDPTGRAVRTLPVTDVTPLAWDGRDQAGARVPAGSYWAILQSRTEARSVPLTILR